MAPRSLILRTARRRMTWRCRRLSQMRKPRARLRGVRTVRLFRALLLVFKLVTDFYRGVLRWAHHGWNLAVAARSSVDRLGKGVQRVLI
jgi:hypothetical protein